MRHFIARTSCWEIIFFREWYFGLLGFFLAICIPRRTIIITVGRGRRREYRSLIYRHLIQVDTGEVIDDAEL